MTATVTRGGTAAGTGAPARRAVRRRRLGFPRASTTPGKVRLTRAALVLARGDETLNLISRTGDTDFQADFQTAQGQLSTLLASAGKQSGPGAAPAVAAARQDADSWFAVNRQAQKLDQARDYGAETRLVIGSGPGSAATLFGRLETDLGAGIRADQAVFAGSAAAGSGAFTGLAAGVAVLALAMAAGCAWGLSRRLAEYR
jgi:hypothetical protein